ncbi:MAG: hypothetical protein ACR2JB_01165 [Bryobacteraceae bacterium]
MISAATAEELDGILIWDWTVEPALYMADRPNRPPRSERPKSKEDRVSQIESRLASVEKTIDEAATKEQLGNVNTSLNGITHQLNEIRDRRGLWKSFWKERNWAIPTVIVLLGMMGTGTYWVAGVIIDRQTKPLADALNQTNQRLVRIEGRLNVQTVQDRVKILAALPRNDLRQHSKELTTLKAELAKAVKTVPEFWPTSFQLISLTSRALSPLESTPPKSGVVSDSNSVEVRYSVVTLKGHVSQGRFIDCVIIFDPSVRLNQVLFVNCVFEFPAGPYVLQPTLERIGGALLASDISNVTLTT